MCFFYLSYGALLAPPSYDLPPVSKYSTSRASLHRAANLCAHGRAALRAAPRAARRAGRVGRCESAAQVLGEGAENQDYILITNFDYFWHDIREKFDPTGHGGFLLHPTRREQAPAVIKDW